ncbi:ArsR family transcriptional regulator [Halovenus sp. WSH3]|uniref:ArsR family transcriptional regulator n=1 Tax=Halovenus carboxidivorans TaxID=2692199 RepID=A0A6B0T4F0_9EURY|nr:winged helix-turn-helix domain-containing protein [Halovenus carboxidivorans]MXR50172.1 ArsR family transcriptional regulator [Halovenus carboxidivorans]
MDRGEDHPPDANSGSTVDARDAFALLGHEIRLDILFALLEDWMAVYTEPKSYAELMAAVGLEDSGKFNYHLSKLQGVYVEKVDDGYVPTASATALYRTVLATRPTETVEFEQPVTEAACPDCGGQPVLEYERGFVAVACQACDSWDGFTYPFPQNGFEQHEESLLEAVQDRVRHEIGLARTGQCPACAGQIAVDPRIESVDGDDHWIELGCESCTFVVGVEPLSTLLTDDRVGSALREIGIDPTGHGWERPDEEVSVSRDPVRLEIAVATEQGTVTITATERLAVERVAVG